MYPRVPVSRWVAEVVRHPYKFDEWLARIARGAPWAGSVTGGEACGYPCSEKRGSHIRGSGEHRAFGAPMNRNCTLWTLRVALLKALSLLRFFVAKDQEMTRRHAQWLIVIEK